jgi:hypothetical protein
MHSEQGRIFFYTHWDGYKLPKTVQAALKRGEGRWNDPAYLGRIVFSQMISGHLMEETGYGISLVIPDNSYPLLVIDADAKQVCFEDGPGVYSSKKAAIGKSLSFEAFCALDLSCGDDPWEVIADLPQK